MEIMKQTMTEFNKQMSRKDAVLNHVFEIEEDIKSEKINRDKKLSNGKSAINEVTKIEMLNKEKEALEEIIREDKYFDLTKARELWGKEMSELKARRSKRLKENQPIENEILKKYGEIEELLSKLLSENEDMQNEQDYFIDCRHSLYPNSTDHQHHLGDVIPNIDFDGLTESEIFQTYKFRATTF